MGSCSEVVVVVAECGCCGMWEECTVEYVAWVKERFGGVWVCGLCEEAVKDEQARLDVGVEEALRLHASFREAAAADPTIVAVRELTRLLKKMIVSSPSSK